MFLKNWFVIAVLSIVGLGLMYFWLTADSSPPGVTPQSGETDATTLAVTLAGAITTVGGAIFGVLGKFNDYRKAKLEIEAKELEIEEKRQQLENK